MTMLRGITGLLALAGLPLLAQAEPVSMTLCHEDTSNPPFYYEGNKHPPGKPGITIEVLHRAAKSQDIALTLLPLPWKRCLVELKNNTVDGAFEFSYKAEREAFAVYPQRDGQLDKRRYLHELSYHLFTLNDANLQWDGAQMSRADAKLAAVSGYSVIGDLRQKGYTVHEGINQRSNLEMLLRGRVDGLAHIATITRPLIQDNPAYAKVKQHPLPLSSKRYYLVFGKSFYTHHKNSAEALWDEILHYREQGITAELAAQYAQ